MPRSTRRDHEIVITVDVDEDHPHRPSKVELARLEDAVSQALTEADPRAARISVALVDDPTIHRLNREFLAHDFPTDVITFPLSDDPAAMLEGEIVASLDTAGRVAARLGWPAQDELLLYVVHGALHLVGYDDQEPAARRAMRAAELRNLARFGLRPPEVDSRHAVT